MTVEQRLKIIEKIAKMENLTKEDVMYGCIMDELIYANMKAGLLHEYREIEIAKVFKAYDTSLDKMTDRIKKYVQRICRYKDGLGLADHYNLNDNISMIGEYYDGEPTADYRSCLRDKITPVRLDDDE